MKNTRINWRNARCSTGEILRYPLARHECQTYVWARATGEFSITLDFLKDEETGEVVTVPVAYGSSVDGAYCFDGAIALNIIPKSKSVMVASYVSQTGVNRRETVDPIPKRLVIPTSQDSFEQRLLRQFTDLLDQRTGRSEGRGREYTVQDEYSDSDPDFGSGYEVDEYLEGQLDADIAARRSGVADTGSKRVQSSDVSDNDKRDGSGVDVRSEPGKSAPKPGSNPDQSERIAALEAALRDLRKSSS